MKRANRKAKRRHPWMLVVSVLVIATTVVLLRVPIARAAEVVGEALAGLTQTLSYMLQAFVAFLGAIV